MLLPTRAWLCSEVLKIHGSNHVSVGGLCTVTSISLTLLFEMLSLLYFQEIPTKYIDDFNKWKPLKAFCNNGLHHLSWTDIQYGLAWS